MAYIDGPKYTGPLTFDLTPEKDDLYDIHADLRACAARAEQAAASKD